jgi:hypothetical protein
MSRSSTFGSVILGEGILYRQVQPIIGANKKKGRKKSVPMIRDYLLLSGSAFDLVVETESLIQVEGEFSEFEMSRIALVGLLC